MTTYTITDNANVTSGLSIIDAADELLSNDGHEYDIRREDDCWSLYVSRYSRNSTAYNGLSRSVIFSLADDEDAAREEIARSVVESGRWERGSLSCMTDQQYTEMMAQIAADEEG